MFNLTFKRCYHHAHDWNYCYIPNKMHCRYMLDNEISCDAQFLVGKEDEGKEDVSKIQVREPGGKILRSHGEAAAFMEEDGSYGEEDIQNLYNNTCLKGIPPLRSASPEDTTLFIGFNK